MKRLPPHFALERAIDQTEDLSSTAVLIGYLIASAMGSKGACWPGLDSLAARARANERTVRRAIKELRDAELITTKQRRNATLIYRLHDNVDRTPMSTPEPPDRTLVSAGPDTSVHLIDQLIDQGSDAPAVGPLEGGPTSDWCDEQLWNQVANFRHTRGYSLKHLTEWIWRNRDIRSTEIEDIDLRAYLKAHGGS